MDKLPTTDAYLAPVSLHLDETSLQAVELAAEGEEKRLDQYGAISPAPLTEEPTALVDRISSSLLRERFNGSPSIFAAAMALTALFTSCGSSHSHEATNVRPAVAASIPHTTTETSPPENNSPATGASSDMTCPISGTDAARLAGASPTRLFQPTTAGAYITPAVCEFTVKPASGEATNFNYPSVVVDAENQSNYRLSTVIRNSPGENHTFTDRPDLGSEAWSVSGTNAYGDDDQIHFPLGKRYVIVAVFEPKDAPIKATDAANQLAQLILSK